MSKKSNNWLRNLLNWLPGILISALAIFVLSRFVNFTDLSNAMSHLNVGSILIIIILFIISLFTRGLAWREMLAHKASMSDSFFGVVIGYMLNNIIPWSGEFGKAILLGASTGFGTLYVLSTVIIERALDLAIAAGMFLSTLPFVLKMDWLRPIAILMILIVLSALIVLLVMANNKVKVHAWVTEMGGKNQWIKKYILPGLDSLLNGFGILTNPKRFIISFFWILSSWFCWILLFYTALISIVPNAPFWWAIFCEAVLAMGIALPSAPASLGVYEGTLVVALSIFGIAQSSSLGIALILHLIQIVITFIFGIIGLFKGGWSLNKLIKQMSVKNLPEKE